MAYQSVECVLVRPFYFPMMKESIEKEWAGKPIRNWTQLLLAPFPFRKG